MQRDKLSDDDGQYYEVRSNIAMQRSGKSGITAAELERTGLASSNRKSGLLSVQGLWELAIEQ
jgi:hypothetical protein